MMLSSGKKVLLDAAPTLGFEELTYSTVFEHLQATQNQKVTIGSVHERIWQSQRDFQLDVVTSLLKDVVTPTAEQVLGRAAEAIGQLDVSTPAARRYALQSAIRNNASSLFGGPHDDAINIAHTVRFRLWALGADHPEAQDCLARISEIRHASLVAYSNVVRGVMQVIGLQVRNNAGDPDEVIESIALLGNATIVGLMTDVVPQANAERLLPTGPRGQLEAWYPDALALWSLASTMLELSGDDLSADDRRL